MYSFSIFKKKQTLAVQSPADYNTIFTFTPMIDIMKYLLYIEYTIGGVK